MKRSIPWSCGLLLSAVVLTTPVLGQSTGPFTIKKNEHGAEITIGGQPFASYVIDQANKPYLWPVFGPTGKRMVRAYPIEKVDGEQHDHPHHRGICWGHESIDGSNTWAEGSTYAGSKRAEEGNKLGAIKHREFKKLDANNDSATIFAGNDLFDKEGKKALEADCKITLKATPAARIIDFDIIFIATEKAVTFEDRKDAGFSIRVPTSMAVDSKKGGRIINSEGETDAGAWSKRAKWCDYYGPVEGETLGVAMLNHPSSFRHPTTWHVRTYGLFTANPFGPQSLDKKNESGTFTLAKGDKVQLRHRLIFHTGDEKQAKIAEAYAAYAKEQ